VVAGGAIDFDEIPWPEILDPRRVEGEHPRTSVFLECSITLAGTASSTFAMRRQMD
jgi:hypothetical protein